MDIRPAYLVGLDIGQMHDPTALAIVRQRVIHEGAIRQLEYEAQFLKRFELGMPYPDIVEKVSELLRHLPKPRAWQDEVHQLQTASPHRRAITPPLYRLIIDATGVGRPIADMFARLVVRAVRVTITGGHEATNPTPDEWHVPKPSLIGTFQVVLGTERFKVNRALPEATMLVKETQNFQYKISAAGNDTYGAWREGQHDDLLLAVCLAIWYGEQTPPRQERPWTPSRVASPTGGRPSRTRV